MPLFHYSHFCRILRQKKKEEKMSNVCFLPFANSSVHKVSGNNGSGNYIRHFHKFFISKLWAAEADALLSLLPKKEKRATKITPRREKSHISMWVHHKYQRKWFWSCCFEMKRSNSVASTPPTIRVKPDHEKIHNNGADTVKRLHIFLWDKVKDFVF